MKLKEKIRRVLFTSGGFDTKREVIYFVLMCSSIIANLVLIIFMYLVATANSDLVTLVDKQYYQIEEANNDALKYKMMYEETYKMCVEKEAK
jgi:hypothetical protein